MSLVELDAPDYCLIHDRVHAVYCFVVESYS